MISRRQALAALTALGSTIRLRAVGGPAPEVMGSTVFDWSSIPAQATKTGFTRKFFQRPTATLDELECHVTTLNPGESPHAPHKHPDEELVIIKEGTVEAFLNGQTYRAGPGSVIFQASNQVHGLKNVGEVAATYHVIKWNSPGMLKKKGPGAGGQGPVKEE